MLETKEYNAIYANGEFERITLSGLKNKGGAEGKIFNVENQPKVVAKIFHKISNSSTNRKKLEAMLHNQPTFPPTIKDGIEYVQIAWPNALLEDDKGFCVGYLMPKIDVEKAVSLDHIMQKAIRKKLKLPERYSFRVFAAYNVASMVAALHEREHFVIDLKPSNLYAYKENMMVAMVDCDGFSIKGKNNNRYGAEFVSEEYIYPEGMIQTCAEMGIDQDKFSLSIIIFKLLNNGIHPFSGAPRKADERMQTIQERIENYHYAYGLWPDIYQAPHPYSLHEYFDHQTLELFERAFAKNQIRPTAKEWVEHLAMLLNNIKDCRKNYEHGFFTAKGCGACIVEEKFLENIAGIQKQKEAPKTIRGLEVSELKNENIQKNKEKLQNKNNLLQNYAFGGIFLYMLFFSFLHKFTDYFSAEIVSLEIGIQAIIITILMIGINKMIYELKDKISIFESKYLSQMLKVYAFICMLIAFVKINNIPLEIFDITVL